MDAKKLRALSDRYQRLLWGVTDPELTRELRRRIANSEAQAAELEATADGGGEDRRLRFDTRLAQG